MSAPTTECCQHVSPHHWNNHNRQIRYNGRCACWCHGTNVRDQQAPHRPPLDRVALLAYREELDGLGCLPLETVQRIIDSHLAVLT